ncbi:MAG: hypothetical protein VB071_13275 [Lawsonibacter sp.]|nr:hypothetical protein [Lawsonibacter sp.]
MANRKSTKAAGLLLCLLFCIAMALSIFFIAAETDHTCTGADCPICAEILACANVLGTAAIVPMAAVVCAALPLRLMQVQHGYEAEVAPFTLVSRKVKLSN